MIGRITTRCSLALASLCAIGCLLAAASPAAAQTTYPLLSQISGTGAPQGPFTSVTASDGVAVDHAAGRIYVANQKTQSGSGVDAVYVLDLSGAYLETWTGEDTPAGSFGDVSLGVAVDEAGGTVYVTDEGHRVVDRFSVSGGFQCEITGAGYLSASAEECDASKVAGEDPAVPGGGEFLPHLAAVDPADGDLYVDDDRSGHGQGGDEIDVFAEDGRYLSEIPAESGQLRSIALDAAGSRLYAIEQNDSGKEVIQVSTATGGHLETWEGPPGELFRPEALAVDEATGDVLATISGSVAAINSGGVDVFDPGGQIVGEIGDGLVRPNGLTVDQATGRIYVVDGEPPLLDVFGPAPAVIPTVATGAASGLEPSTATLGGTVDPEGLAVEGCQFEYVAASAYHEAAGDPFAEGHTAPCGREGGGPIGEGQAPVAVEAPVSGLTDSTVYRFRLRASDEDGIAIAPTTGSFRTPGPPAITDLRAISATTDSAELGAEVNPDGLPTGYRLEYGATTAYGQVLEGELPAGGTPLAVSFSLSGLEPGHTYHYRLVAGNAASELEGSPVVSTDHEFSTYAVRPPGLPDGRAYELVSRLEGSADKEDGNAYAVGNLLNINFNSTAFAGHSVQSSPSGGSVVYGGDPSDAGNGILGNEYLATRGPDGWEARDLDLATASPSGSCVPEHIETPYALFDEDLTVGALTADPSPAIAAATGAPGCYTDPFVRRLDGSLPSALTALLTAAPADRSPGGEGGGGAFGPEIAGASADLSRVFFAANDALDPEAGAVGPREYDLYEWHEGALRTVDVSPTGTALPDAVYGSLTENQYYPDTSHVISADGRRAYWTYTAKSPTRLYLSEEGSPTVQVDAKQGGSGSSGGGVYLDASADGSRAFFSDESELTPDSKAGAGAPDLYRFEPGAEAGHRLTDLTPEAVGGGPADVQGIAAVSEDGSYVYLVAKGVLTGEADAEGAHAVPGGDNLYLSHAGTTAFVGTLAERDDKVNSGELLEITGDWQASQAADTTRVTPDGTHLAFASTASLTGYPNAGQDEVYTYDAETGRLDCVSCDPTGVTATAPSMIEPSQSDGYQQRWIVDGGERVFFDSKEALVAGDTNGNWDVYEWEAEGTGGCGSEGEDGGCLFLVSDGTSPGGSYFDDATPSGDDVFLTTRSRLVGADEDEQLDVYDARVGGGFAEAPPPPACGSGEACHGAAAPATPGRSHATESFDGPTDQAPPVARKKHHHGKRHHHKKRHHRKKAGKRATDKKKGGRR